jgi:hypothetical protein
MSFYVGCYLILSDQIAPKHDHDGWELPDIYGHQGHMSDTSNVEELLIDPEDMDLIPTQIQFGCAEYTADEGFTPIDCFTEFYVKDEAFYTRGFSPTDYWTEFYVAGEPFYVRGFFRSPRIWTTEFYPATGFYARSFSPTDYWSEFYVAAESFYVRSFSPTDTWAEFYAPTC